MADNEMKIILSLVDKATADLKAIKNEIDGVKKPLDDVDKKGKETNKNLDEGFKKSASQARTFRRDIMLVVGVLAGIVAATREYAKYNDEARISVDKFDLEMQKMAVTAGKVLLPAVKVITQAFEGWGMIFDLASNAMAGKGFFLSPSDDEINKIITAGQEIKNVTDKQKQLNDEFVAGKISVDDYYRRTTEGGLNAINERQQEANQLREISFLRYQISNEDLMNEQRVTSEKINLLNYYKENYAIAHQGMSALTVTLGKAIQTNLSTAITGIITGTMKARDAFKAFGQAMIQAIADFMVQKMVAWVLEKTLLAGTVAAAIPAGAAVAAAWAPAALAANVASFGGAGVAAAASFATAGIALGTAMGMASAAGASSGARGASIGVDVGSAVGHSSGVETGGAFASGGSGIVSRPTLFLAGEAGPERFNFTPVGKEIGGNRIANYYIDINVDQPTISKESDIDYLTEQISRKLSLEVERLR